MTLMTVSVVEMAGRLFCCICLLALYCCCFLSEAARTDAADPGKILSLPGAPSPIPFNQYAGFVTVNETHGRKLFYWFVTTNNNTKNNDPVVLWLNGGPGCSSLGGFFTELGPFYPLASPGSLAFNRYSWNLAANLIFLESPSGVGFSYSQTPSDYHTGDEQTTQDSLQFLIKFFELYPEFANNDFWVTGESYGGHYVPWLANAVVEYNNKSPAQPINIQGFMVGNPWTDPASDNWGAATFWANSGIISNATYTNILRSCNFSSVGPFIMMIKNPPKVQDDCSKSVEMADQEMGDINLYAIYANVCTHSGYNYRGPAQRFHLGGSVDQDPCIGSYLVEYLNRDDVKEAIHASDSPNKWSDCSGLVDYSRRDLLTPVLPLYHKFISEGKLRILVYSGDVDGVVPHTGTERWLSTLGLTYTDFEPWSATDSQVGGYVIHYKEMTYATVRGAGHMVPGTQPLYALDMFEKFLSGTL